MLRQRIITASIAGLLTIAAVLFLPSVAVGALLALLVVSAASEWAGLTALSRPVQTWGYVALVAGLTLAVAWWTQSHGVWVPIAAGAVWWMLAVGLLALYPVDPVPIPTPRYGLAVAGVFALVPAWTALLSLHQQSAALLLYLFGLVWLADTAAYFSGRRWGTTRLAPNLSPGKTRAGLWGALMAVAVYALAGSYGFGLTPMESGYFLLLCLLTALFSVVGDLFESLLKRTAGVKDSGHALPGHGGILDRIDSLTAAAPIFALGYYWIQ